MDFTVRLRMLRKELKLKQKELAEKLNLSQKTLSNYETGTREPDQETMIKMAIFFDVSVDYLLGFSDIRNSMMYNSGNINEFPSSAIYPVASMIKIPVLKFINTQGPAFTIENIIDYVSLPSEDLPQGEYFGYQIKNNAMNLSHIVDGCIVIIRKQDYIDNSQIALVIIDNEEPIINRILKSDNNITLIPHSTDATYFPRFVDSKSSKIKFIGRIVQSIIQY